jgi:hypothetical protein
MADAYLAISEIANDEHMTERLNAAVTQQQHLEAIDLGKYATSPYNLTAWVASPGWGGAWESALAAHPPDAEPDYEPGKDPAVITDGMILATVQALGGGAE